MAISHQRAISGASINDSTIKPLSKNKIGDSYCRARLIAVIVAAIVFSRSLVVMAEDNDDVVPGTQRLTVDQPLDVLMVEGIDRFCLKEIALAREQRKSRWMRNSSSLEAYEAGLKPYRDRFRVNIGAVDDRIGRIQFDRPLSECNSKDRVADNDHLRPNYSVVANRWPTLPGITAEGLVLVPDDPNWKGAIIAIPDSRWSPDAFVGAVPGDHPAISRMPQTLAENGFLVVVPTLIGRDDEFAGNPEIAMTNQSNREWVYRSAFEVGRHVIGYEVQKVLALVDLLTQMNHETKRDLPISVAGVGDGGQIALYSAALDNRIRAALVSGYFQPREAVWQEPIDRNVWRLLTEFGDAEIAGMIAPRPLIIEACSIPETEGPLPVRPGRRGGAAPGTIKTADLSAVREEFHRAKAIYDRLKIGDRIHLLTSGPDGHGESCSDPAIKALAGAAGWTDVKSASGRHTARLNEQLDQKAIQQRQVSEAVEFTQRLLRRSYKTRDKLFSQADRSSAGKWVESAEKLRQFVHQELIGQLPEPTMPPNPRTRKVLSEKEYTGYEVVLDTYPDVIAAGILLLPTGMKPGEKRPVVVCQHGLEGVPMDTISGPPAKGYTPYKSFTAELAKRGFITYAPQNPYRGEDLFRTLQRKSNPLGRSLFSYIIPQHQVTLKWLASLPNVDSERLAFYGLSYGGKTAVRVPPMLPPRDGKPGYCLSICSADYNEWVSKNACVDAPFAYVFTPEYEIFEWNMAHVANYAELSMLMTPRPFMVERGHDDGVGIDEWVAYEYAKVRRHYDKLGLGDKTEIEFFDGPHTINGKGTFAFLHRNLNWPAPQR